MGKKVNFIKDNMLNPLNNSNLYKLLYYISSNKNVPVERLFKFDFEYSYIPRIYLENVVVSLKKWIFDETLLSSMDYKLFNEQIEFLSKKFDIDNEVYLVELDNRLIIRLNNLEDRKILFNIYKNKKLMVLSELEGKLCNSLVRTNDNRILVNEFVFSFILSEDNKNKIYNELDYEGSQLIEEERIILPFQNGWIYLKIYGLGNRFNEFLSKKLYFLDELNISKWFFIRYYDEKGEHIRLRLKFKNEDIALESYKIIYKHLLEMKKNNVFKNFYIDTYERELNRYGGLELINLFEQYSYLSSVIVREILKKYNIHKNKEKIYLFFIIKILNILGRDLEDMFKIIEKDEYIKIYRKEYIKNRKEYVQYTENIINNTCDEFLEINDIIVELEITLLKIKSIIYEKNVSNDYKNIINSIIHMHCNRLTGDLNYELRCSALARHAIFDLLEKQKYFNSYNNIRKDR